MVRRRRAREVRDVRTAMAERFRALDEHFELDGWRGPWLRKAEQLAAGEPVVVDHCELKDFLSAAERFGSHHWRIEPDGALTPVRPVKHGSEIIRWDPIRSPSAGAR